MGNTVQKVISTQSRKFTIIRSDEFIIRSVDEYKHKDSVFCMKRLKLNYSSHVASQVYEEK